MRLSLALVLAVAVAAPLAAEEPPGLRFEIAPGEAGVTRVDTQTGAVSHCTARNGAWICEPAAVAAEPRTGADRAGPRAALRAVAIRLVDRLVAMAGRLKHPHRVKPATPAAS